MVPGRHGVGMRRSIVRILIGAAVGFAGLMLLPASTTRWAALGAWVVLWTFVVVRREAGNDRRAVLAANSRASLEAAVAATERLR
jgi:hypothetical protein